MYWRSLTVVKQSQKKLQYDQKYDKFNKYCDILDVELGSFTIVLY